MKPQAQSTPLEYACGTAFLQADILNQAPPSELLKFLNPDPMKTSTRQVMGYTIGGSGCDVNQLDVGELLKTLLQNRGVLYQAQVGGGLSIGSPQGPEGTAPVSRGVDQEILVISHASGSQILLTRRKSIRDDVAI